MSAFSACKCNIPRDLLFCAMAAYIFTQGDNCRVSFLYLTNYYNWVRDPTLCGGTISNIACEVIATVFFL